MSKRGYIYRYMLIIKKLRAKPYSTFEEIENYIHQQQQYDEFLDAGFSLRTFQRDIKEIYALFGIIVEYSKKLKGYFISHDAEHESSQRMIEAFDVFNSLNIAQDLAHFIHLEKRKPLGTEYLCGFIHAIKHRLLVTIWYTSFWDAEGNNRRVEPYALKEFKNRWYVLAKDHKDGNIKSFALDRLCNLEITPQKFVYPEAFSMEDYYHNCFGIMRPDSADEKPKEIILSFDTHQGKYIKTLPLHETQQIVVDNEEELRIKLRLYITHDLIMELLSFGSLVKVLQPVSLAKELKSWLSF